MKWKLAYRLTVYGMPAPQGSKRHLGNGVLVESSKKVKPWRAAVHAEAVAARCYTNIMRPVPAPIDGPVRVLMTFTMPKPASAPKRRASYPMRTPDLSKLVRSTEDALTDAGIWRDDARVIECVAAKVYPGEGQDALDCPGAVIVVFSLREPA